MNDSSAFVDNKEEEKCGKYGNGFCGNSGKRKY